MFLRAFIFFFFFLTSLKVWLARRPPSLIKLFAFRGLTDRLTDHAMHSLLFSLPVDLKYFLNTFTSTKIIIIIIIVMDRFFFIS